MKTYWKWMVAILVLVTGTWIWYLPLDSKVQTLEGRVAALEERTTALCGNILRLSEVDSDLIAAGTAEDPGKIEPLFDKIFSAQAYCQGRAYVSIDLRQEPGSRITFQGTEVTSHLRSFSSLEGDFEIILVNEEGSVSVNPGNFVEAGDLVKVWVSSEKPELTAFYDEVTGLAISILHVDGSFEPSRYE